MHEETFQKNPYLIVQEFEVAFDCNKTNDVHGLFQEDYWFMNEIKIVDQLYGIL